MAKIKFKKAEDSKENEHESSNGVNPDGRLHENEPARARGESEINAGAGAEAEINVQDAIPPQQERIQVGKGIVFNSEGLEEAPDSAAQPEQQSTESPSVISPQESSGYSGSEIKKAGGSPEKNGGVRFTKDGIRAKFVESGAVVAPNKSRAKKFQSRKM